MTPEEARALKPGLYRLEFADGEALDCQVQQMDSSRTYYETPTLYRNTFTHCDWSPVTHAIPLVAVPTMGLSDFQLLALAVLLNEESAIPPLLDEAEARYYGRPSVEERIERAKQDARDEMWGFKGSSKRFFIDYPCPPNLPILINATA